MVKRIVASVFIMVFCAAMAVAQGTSPVKVTGISVAPATFKAGDQVTITVNLQNTATTPYGCVGTAWFAATVYIYKEAPYTVANQLWQGSAALTAPLAAGARKTVVLTTKWTVPELDTPTYHFQAWSPVCAPDEFGQTTVLKINKTCVYKYVNRFEFVRLPIKDLALLKK